MTMMTGPGCAVMCNLINTHTVQRRVSLTVAAFIGVLIPLPLIYKSFVGFLERNSVFSWFSRRGTAWVARLLLVAYSPTVLSCLFFHGALLL